MNAERCNSPFVPFSWALTQARLEAVLADLAIMHLINNPSDAKGALPTATSWASYNACLIITTWLPHCNCSLTCSCTKRWREAGVCAGSSIKPGRVEGGAGRAAGCNRDAGHHARDGQQQHGGPGGGPEADGRPYCPTASCHPGGAILESLWGHCGVIVESLWSKDTAKKSSRILTRNFRSWIQILLCQ